jgi:hypothetical protein
VDIEAGEQRRSTGSMAQSTQGWTTNNLQKRHDARRDAVMDETVLGNKHQRML